MVDTQPIVEKLKLTREESQELRIFFMIGKRPLRNMIVEEKVVAILAYQLEDAFSKAKKENPGFGLLYHGQNTTVRELLSQLQTDSVVSLPTHSEEGRVEKPDPPEKISLEQFRTGLMLVADEYVTDPNDQKELKRIISELELSNGLDKNKDKTNL